MSARVTKPIEGYENRSLSAPTRGQVEGQIEALKEQLLKPVVAKLSNAVLLKEISWAANEAAALAWCTVCPILVLPALFEEKVRAAFAKWEKQQRLRPAPRRHVRCHMNFLSFCAAA